MNFTVVNTFTLKDPARAAEFEERFLSHVEWMRGRPGFVAHQAVRSTEQPGVYVNFGWWEKPEDFQAVLASDTFKEHAEEFHRIVDVVADPSAGVLRLDGASAGDGDHLVVEFFTDQDPGAYRGYAQADGFVGADVARSLFARPGGFTALTRWRSAEQAAAARAPFVERALPASPIAGNRADLAAGAV
ncbi:antibiotic biosynthesis monooxygenase family protein [Streptomyces collinus]|uniref:Acyl-CoA ligase n=1 Tax=Streptomyces collinus (strain DSM 40733 / Tue 365) TaxID=1214242 RepID=S5V2Q0_STRC3|nr:antibiotic biosynthesis monooxygenase family protein [Streptomyces collinus]AGS69489.1 acyl-CoA ligase [Streptomyces collinus Tu 365]UJA08130.1 antibiotic biosynthesis monooxygenase [Streptomyces collinus]UJA17005.1 antibiotic biosynthesis monooxygenase [Streptomyces collinus]